MSARHAVSTKQLADHIGVTPQRVNQYVADGMPKLSRNQFDLDICCQWIRKFEKDSWEAEQARAANVKDYWTAKAEHEAILTQRDQDRLRQSRGELIEVPKMLQALDRSIISLRDNLLGRGRRISDKLVGKTQQQIAQALEDSDRLILEEISQAFARLGSGKPEPPKRRRKVKP